MLVVPSKEILTGSLSCSKVRPCRTDGNINEKIVVIKCSGLYLEICSLNNPVDFSALVSPLMLISMFIR